MGQLETVYFTYFIVLSYKYRFSIFFSIRYIVTRKTRSLPSVYLAWKIKTILVKRAISLPCS